jgi:hypothetical protein
MGGRESSSQRENSNADDELLNLISLIMNTPATTGMAEY